MKTYMYDCSFLSFLLPDQIVILLTVNHTIVIILVQRI